MNEPRQVQVAMDQPQPFPALVGTRATAETRFATSDEPANSRRVAAAETAGVLVVFVQVVLVAAVMIVGGLESSAFRRLVLCAAGGFLVHHFLPRRWRLGFFAALSLAALVLVMGGVPGRPLPDLSLGLSRAGLVVAVGAGLIALCHLPLAFGARVLLLLAAAALLAAFRAGYLPDGGLSIVWPVLAALFMFRTIVYLYERSSGPGAAVSLPRSLGYFFLLPNSCALLFPVVDFRAFCQKYYDEPALAIYQRGATWMVRGVLQLLFYHVVNLTLAIKAADVADGTDLARYVITNIFLYVKISGGFHLFIGVLLLFGFNLPETNRRYFLAASFTDYWRRVNIYWREFMMRVFYYPAFFRLKRIGQTRALALAILWTFFVTWALHQYQAWWVTGATAASWPDTLFWAALALLVLGSALRELHHGRTRRLVSRHAGLRESAGLVMRTAATFAVITVLWSLWSAPSVGEWLRIWKLADRHTLTWGAAAIAAIVVATVVFEIRPSLRGAAGGAPLTPAPRFGRDAFRALATLAVLVVGIPGLLRLPVRADAVESIADARSVLRILRQCNPPSEARGYYEKLTNVDPGNQQYWETVQLRVTPFHYAGETPVRQIAGFPLYEPLPNVRVHAYDVDFRTNRWGLRGPDYELAPANGTVRVALLGSSHVMGWGLPAEATFGAVLEDALNRSRARDGAFEILNFAVPGYGPLGQVAVVRNRVAAFHPHVVVHVAHLNDSDWVNRDVVRCLRAGAPFPDPAVGDILRRARVTARTHPLMATDRLRPYEPELLRSVYGRIVEDTRALHAVPVCVIMPLPRGDPAERGARERLANIAATAGFEVIDLSRLYDGRPTEELEVNEPGHHSNALAHALIARELYRQLTDGAHAGVLTRARRLAALASRPPAAAESFGQNSSP